MLQVVADHSSHVMTVNAFLGCTTATALLIVRMAVMNIIAVSVDLQCDKLIVRIQLLLSVVLWYHNNTNSSNSLAIMLS